MEASNSEQGAAPKTDDTGPRERTLVVTNPDPDAGSEEREYYENEAGGAGSSASPLGVVVAAESETVEMTQTKAIVAENDKVQEELQVLQTPVSEYYQGQVTPPPPRTSRELLDSERVVLERKISEDEKEEEVGTAEEEQEGEKSVSEAIPAKQVDPEPQVEEPEPGPSSTTASTSKRRKPKSAISSSSLGIVDDNTPVRGEVIDFHSSEIVTRRLTFPSKLIFSRPHIPYQEGWAFQKVFHEEELMASGFLFLEVNGRKPIKHTKNNTYMMLVLEGAVAVEIHRTTYVLCPGSSFHLPRGNTYSIANISNREAKLFFVQAVQTPPSPSHRNDSLLSSLKLLAKPTTRVAMLFHWLAPRIISRYLELRKVLLIWYRQNLEKYEPYLGGRRAYWLCFLLGLMIRRLPFIGSPPILNIQFVRARR